VALDTWLYHTPTGCWLRVTGWLVRDGVGYVCGETDDGMWAWWPVEECAGV